VFVRLVTDVELLEGQKGSGMPKMADTVRFIYIQNQRDATWQYVY